MSYTSDQAQFQFIGNVTYNSAATIDALPAGSLAVIDMDGAVKTDAISATAYYKIVQKKADGNLLYSPLIYGGDIISKSQTAFSPTKNMVKYLGANTSGSVTGLGTHTAGDGYSVGIGIKNYGESTTSEFYSHIAYTAVTGDTDKTVSKALFESAQRVKRNTPFNYVNVDRIADVASIAAFTGTGVIYKFTKNSKVVSTYVKDADATSGVTASTMSIADGAVVAIASTNGRTFTFTADIAGTGAGRHVVYIGSTVVNVADAGTAAQNATAIATAINASATMSPLAYASASDTTVTVTYKNDFYAVPPMVMQTDDDSTWVNVAVTTTVGEYDEIVYHADGAVTGGATFTMDAPWQGETAYLYETTGTGSTASCGVATLTASKYGLKFSALPVPGFDPVNSNDLPITFVVDPLYGSTAFETTVGVYDAQAGETGTGTYKQVAKKEILTQFQNKGTNLQVFPRTKYKTEADADNTYTLIELRLKNELNTTMIGANPKTFITIELATESTLTDNTTLATVFGL